MILLNSAMISDPLSMTTCVEVTKNQYYFVSCKFCDNEGMDAPLEGQIFEMEKHLSKCSAYIRHNNTGTGHCSTSSLSGSSCLLKLARSETQPSVSSISKLNTRKLQSSWRIYKQYDI